MADTVAEAKRLRDETLMLIAQVSDHPAQRPLRRALGALDEAFRMLALAERGAKGLAEVMEQLPVAKV